MPRPTSRARSASSRRRRDEDPHRLGHRLAHLARALHLDLEHHGDPARDAPVELGAQRPVAPARVAGVLDELAGRRARSNSASEEVVVDAVLLARPRVARGGRHRQLELRDPLEQAADQRALADPRGSGDDEDAGQGGR